LKPEDNKEASEKAKVWQERNALIVTKQKTEMGSDTHLRNWPLKLSYTLTEVIPLF